jgi:hypothetical protein
MLRNLMPRLRSLILLLLLLTMTFDWSLGQAQISPPAIRPLANQVLMVDDGTAEDSIGGSGDPGFGWFNQLTPDAYPATLREVQVAFSNSSNGVRAGSPFRLLVYTDPEGDGPQDGQRPVLTINVTANNPGALERYTLPQEISIDQGSFVVGVLDTIFVADLPAFIDLNGGTTPRGSRSFFTLDNGASFARVDRAFPSFDLTPGNWIIRAVADVQALPPVISRASFRNNKLKIFGRNLEDNAIVRINNRRIDLRKVFNAPAGRLTINGTAAQLNLNPSGQSNRLVVIIDGVASAPFDFTT